MRNPEFYLAETIKNLQSYSNMKEVCSTLIVRKITLRTPQLPTTFVQSEVRQHDVTFRTVMREGKGRGLGSSSLRPLAIIVPNVTVHPISRVSEYCFSSQRFRSLWTLVRRIQRVKDAILTCRGSVLFLRKLHTDGV